ncbi:MAG: hypothetical protein MK005_07715 [Alcanivorax sp.]|nr:hypothetical protein [Alcanivorax sp.]
MKFNINPIIRSLILLLPILQLNSAHAITFDPTTPLSPYTFFGNVEITGGFPATCLLEFTADISTGSGGAGTMEITGGTASGAFPCGLISLNNLPWGSPNNITPTTGGGANISFLMDMTAPFGGILDCQGSITVPFLNNPTASSIDFSGLSVGACNFSSAPPSILYVAPYNNIRIYP